MSIYATYGAVYLHMKDYAKARPLLTDAYEQAKAMQNGELIESMEPDLAELYAATGEFEKAYRHQKNYADIKDSLFNNERSRSIEVLMNTKVAEKDKAVLTQKLHIAQQKGQLQKKNIWIGGSLLISLLLISLSFALIRNFRHNQKLQQSQINQLSQKQEINQLKAQVRGEEQERQRIARELHDGIASQLWAIKLNVESIQQNRKNKTEGNSNLTPVFQQLNDVTVDVRKTAHNLMPDLLLKEGLAAAVRSLCEKTDRNTKLDVHFQAFGALPKIDKEVELSIYRMVQELIQNVLKHAMDASNLLVQLSYVNTLLSITVEDNGKVVSNTQNIDGVGLQQIRKRTEAFKGHFDLQSISGKGTTAYLEFDLKHWI